jgi:hypothetical protein
MEAFFGQEQADQAEEPDSQPLEAPRQAEEGCAGEAKRPLVIGVMDLKGRASQTPALLLETYDTILIS